MEQVDILVSGGTVLTLDEKDTCIGCGAVAVRGDSIAAVGAAEELKARFSVRKTIDAAGCIVMPGLVNGHTHAAMTCFRGMADDLKLEDWLQNYIFPAEARNVRPELVYWGTLLACAEMIRSGTTTFCDMYIFEEETARASKEAGVRCLAGEVLFDFPSPNFKTSDEGLKYTEDLIRRWAGDPLIGIVVEPHACYTCSDNLLARSKELADRYGVPYAVHLLETKAERDGLISKLGKSPVHFLAEKGILGPSVTAFHCVAMDEEDIRLFADHGCRIVHNPESNMKLASGVAPVPEMLAAGIAVGLGTDGCASNNNLDMFQEMDMAAKLHKAWRLDPTVMSADTVLKMATRMGAAALGMADRIGSLEPGKRADIISIDLKKPHLTPLYREYSHLVYAAKGDDVRDVIINGRIVMENKQIRTLDEDKIISKVISIAEEVKASLKQ
ncbi:MAG: amidohydrolase [Syntrophales bacterium]|nr:amidohydrolase [Syntrophales bacterium]